MPCKTILILEDDSMIKEIYEDCIKSAKNRGAARSEVVFIFAQSIHMAVSLINASGDPDLIVCDHNLVGGDSLQFIKDMRTLKPNIVMIAASNDEGKRQLQLQAGCDVEIDGDAKSTAIEKAFWLLDSNRNERRKRT